MSESVWKEEIARRVPIVQIIVVALILGCGFFLGIIFLLRATEDAPGQAEVATTLTYVAVIVTLAVVAARMVIPTLIVTSARQAIVQGTSTQPQSSPRDAQVEELLAKTGDAGRLWLAFLTKTIVGGAMLEGCVFFCLITYMIERTPLSLGIAIALLAALAFHIPTRAGVIHWIEGQLDLIAQQKQFGAR